VWLPSDLQVTGVWICEQW